MEKIFVTLWILFGIYILVLVMIMADLWSGLRKAKNNGEMRTSYGYKRTVGKLAQYYNVLIALTIVDSMQMSAVWYLLCLIEIKSIYEKAEDKVRLDKAGQVMGKIILNRGDVEEIASSIKEYLNENDKTPIKNE